MIPTYCRYRNPVADSSPLPHLALGTAEDCSLTGDDADGLMYLGRKKGG